MAGKLTPEQKALNKEAVKLRDRAYTQRRNAYSAEMAAALAPIEAGPIEQAVEATDKAFHDAIEAKKAATGEIEAEIEALQQKLERTKQEHEAIITSKQEARKSAWDAKREAQKAAENAVKAKYPDLEGAWSAAAWKPFEDFLPQVAKKATGQAG